jgi:TIGR03009 family protein
MRRAGFTLSALFTATLPVTVLGQAPPAGSPPAVPMNLAPVAPPPAPPVAGLNNPPTLPPALVNHLKAWEQRHKQVQNLYTTCERVVKDTVFRKDKAYTGKVMCMKPNLAWMKIEAKGNPDDYVAYICNGTSVFEYDAEKKQVTEHRIPKNTPNSVGDNLLIEFMSGSMTADDVAKRFDLTLVKEEEFYVHILVKPRLPRDLQEFESMTLVLYGPKTAAQGLDYLPAVVIMRSNNGQSEEHWTFNTPPGSLRTNVKELTPAYFQFVQPPQGWQVKPAAAVPPAGDEPKVARPVTPDK